MKRIYIDIDGVLLTTKHKDVAQNAIPFLIYILSHFDCYWLTTHCRNNNTDNLLEMLSHYFPPNIIKMLHQVKPTKWDTLKTEGIDFDSDFYWIDDYAFEAEKQVLIRKDCINRLIVVNLNRKNELLRICSSYLY